MKERSKFEKVCFESLNFDDKIDDLRETEYEVREGGGRGRTAASRAPSHRVRAPVCL